MEFGYSLKPYNQNETPAFYTKMGIPILQIHLDRHIAKHSSLKDRQILESRPIFFVQFSLFLKLSVNAI